MGRYRHAQVHESHRGMDHFRHSQTNSPRSKAATISYMAEDPLGVALADVRRATRDQVTAVWQSQMERIRDLLSRDWREQMSRVIDDRFADFEAAMKPRILESRREVVRSYGRHWNECFIRMKASDSDRDWCDALLDAAAGLARHCAFFSVKGEAIYYQGSRGFDPPLADVPAVFPVQAAPAFLEVVLSGIQAETSCTSADLSALLAAAFNRPGVTGRALLTPISTDERVAGVLYTENALEPAAISSIALVAGIILDQRLRAAEPSRSSGTLKAALSEEPATPVDAVKKIHSNPRAEKAARLAASRLLLSHYAAVRKGRAAGDVYTPLKAEIDQLRDDFDHPVAYLETELLRSLANGRPELMRR